MKKKLLSVIALALAACLLLGASGLAADGGTPKQEVVYARLDASGAVSGVYVVNAFELSAAGPIVDYASYDSITNLSTTDPITVEDGKITCQVSKAGRFYYQGNLSQAQLPWTIAITYTLDGAAIQPTQLAGASGALAMNLSIRRNEACTGPWFDACALSVTVTLDGNLCANIQAPDGVVAASGGDRLVTFTVLPGSEPDLSVSADVTGFEMAAIQFAGVPLSMNLDLETMDLSALNGELDSLTDGVAQLADGAGQLSDGAAALSEGAVDLSGGALTLLSGMQEMQTGVQQLQTGLDALTANNAGLTGGAQQVSEGLEQLSASLEDFDTATGDLTQLVEGSAQIQAGLDSLAGGLASLQGGYDAYKQGFADAGSDPSELAQANTQAEAELQAMLAQYGELLNSMAAMDPAYAQLPALLEQLGTLLQTNAAVLDAQNTLIDQSGAATALLADGAQTLSDSYAQIDQAIAALPQQLGSLSEGLTQLQDALLALAEGASQLSDGVGDYTGGVTELAAGYRTLADGYASLLSGYETLAGGIGSLSGGAADLSAGASEVADGTAQLRDEVNVLNDPAALQNIADDLLEDFTGGDSEAVSFADPDNDAIQGVQFVFMTQGIHVQTAQTTQVQAQTTTFLQRLLALFGIG